MDSTAPFAKPIELDRKIRDNRLAVVAPGSPILFGTPGVDVERGFLMRTQRLLVSFASIVALSCFESTASGQCNPAEVAKHTALDGALNDNFGIIVAMDGDTAIVGAWGADTAGGSDAGAAYAFIRDGVAWTQQAKLTAGDGATNDAFGLSAAISGDTAVVGSFLDDTPSGANAGSAYVFTRSGTVWTQQAKLTANDAATGDSFGISVAIEGDTIVIGAESDDTAGGVDAGSAYVFTRTGTVWTQQAKLTALDAAAGDRFGYSVSLSGNTAVVGAQSDDTAGGSNAGSAYVFTRCGFAWTQQAKLTASDGAGNDTFGVCVSVSGDSVIVGAYTDDTPGGANAGSAYVFTRSGVSWIQQDKLVAADGAAGDQFGVSVAIFGDIALIGAYTDDPPGGIDAGTVYAFARSNDSCGTAWSQQAIVAASDGAAGDVFGYAVALSRDSVVVGAFSDDTAGGVNAGSVYFLSLGCDIDGDGILDANDVCPNNLPGVPVDATGRPLRDCNGDCLYDGADIQCLVDEMLNQ